MVLWGFYEAYPNNQLLATIHAAALGKNEKMIIFPGVSGSGKTTLASFLITKNWLYAGDDIIGLSNNENYYEVLPFQSALSIKPGSWDLLSPLYPELNNSPIISYSGKDAKFISAPHNSHKCIEKKSRIPCAIVFPKYDKNIETRLQPISSIQAIKDLIEVGIRTGEKLENNLLDKLFDVIEKLPKYYLYYSSMEEAEELLIKSVIEAKK
ncbi:MAG: hypothetical protein U5K55_07125 [Aliarcobacter sp.]|nr:hypothetical protein [Aliarcobacter sp.]